MSLAYRSADRRRAIVHAQLGEQVFEVELHRVLGDIQGEGNGLVGLAAGEQVQYLGFFATQRHVHRRWV